MLKAMRVVTALSVVALSAALAVPKTRRSKIRDKLILLDTFAVPTLLATPL